MSLSSEHRNTSNRAQRKSSSISVKEAICTLGVLLLMCQQTQKDVGKESTMAINIKETEEHV